VRHDSNGAQKMRQKSLELQEAWRQREEDERGVEAAEAKRIKMAKMRERDRIKAERGARIRKREEAEAQRQYAMRMEQIRKEKEKEEEERAEEDERRRIAWEAREAERQRRMPWNCTNCKATGECPECSGKGFHMANFFASNLNAAENPLEFGRKPQGCTVCGGLVPGIRGDVETGTGICIVCDGHGMIWPKLSEDPKPRATQGRRSVRKVTADEESPTSVLQ